MARALVQLDDELFCRDVIPAWERSFGIRFARADFAHAKTVGDTWTVVEQRLIAGVGPNPSGLGVSGATQRTFYLVRRALMAQGLARADVLPRSRLRDLFPWRKRHRMWKHLQQHIGVALPRLPVPASYFVALGLLGTLFFFWLLPGWGRALVHGFGAAVVVSQLQWLRWELTNATVGELTVALVNANYKALSHPYVRNNLAEMRDIVLAGLARCGTEATKVAPAELREGTRLAWS